VTRDEQQGVTPLRGRRPKGRPAGSGLKDDGSWEPEFEGQRPPYAPGNTSAMVHGARSERTIRPLAEQLMQAILEDAEQPDHLRSPMFRFTLSECCRAQAVAEILFDYIDSLGVEDMVRPRLSGTKSPVDQWKAAAAHAASLRSKLGLDPVSYARIAKDLGLASKASEDAIGRLAETGKGIVERREAGLRAIAGGETV
jgi:hypothetical protein